MINWSMHRDAWGMEHMVFKGTLEELGLLRPRKRWLRGTLLLPSGLWVVTAKMKPDISQRFTEVHKSCEAQAEHGKFQVGMRKHFFIVRHRVPRDAVRSLSLNIQNSAGHDDLEQPALSL